MPTVTPPGSQGTDLSYAFAPVYFGFVLALVFTGITVLQAYIYFPSTDRRIVQIIAGVMLILDLASTCLVVQSIYYYLIPNFGSLAPMESFTAELSVDCLLSTVITFISQLYFVFQLGSLVTRTVAVRVVLALIFFTAVGAFVGGVGCTAIMVIHHTSVLAHKTIPLKILFGLAKGFGALCDILATSAMCYWLASSGTDSRIVRTRSLLHSLMVFVMERGALVTLVQTLLLITFYAVPNRLVWLAFHMNVTKLYANTFFAMLNGRSHLKRKLGQPTTYIETNSIEMMSSQIKSGATRHTNSFYPSANKPIPMEMPSVTVTKTVVIADM